MILKKKTQKNKKKTILGNKKQKQMKKKHVGKVKAEFSTSSILKKIDKDNFEKKHVGKYCNNPQCFKKKTTKQNRQNLQLLFSTSSILKKIKSIKIILKKDHKKNQVG